MEKTEKRVKIPKGGAITTPEAADEAVAEIGRLRGQATERYRKLGESIKAIAADAARDVRAIDLKIEILVNKLKPYFDSIHDEIGKDSTQLASGLIGYKRKTGEWEMPDEDDLLNLIRNLPDDTPKKDEMITTELRQGELITPAREAVYEENEVELPNEKVLKALLRVKYGKPILEALNMVYTPKDPDFFVDTQGNKPVREFVKLLEKYGFTGE